MKRATQLIQSLFRPVDIAPLVFFRVAFGALMLWEVGRYFAFDRITRYYVEPRVFFPYMGFDGVRPLPGGGMIILFVILGVLSLAVMTGCFYRLSVAFFCLIFTYVFLLDETQYLNHFYLICLVSFLMIFVPAHRALSVDALLRPRLRASYVPAWSLGLLRGQMAVVYIFGAIAKMNPDWLQGEPMRMWLASRTDFPLIGGWFTRGWMPYVFSYGGLLFDLLIVPALLWRRTRVPALLLAVGFHLTNSRLFNIGIFPFLALAATLLFLPPGWFRFWQKRPELPAALPRILGRREYLIAGAVGAYFLIQCLIPLRHWLYPGFVSWTEEGHLLSWHMRLRDKSGSVDFYASDPATGQTRKVDAAADLTARQYEQMVGRPDMILQMAHYLAGDAGPDAEIHVWAMVSLDGRVPQLLVDPTADLAAQPRTLAPADWILPLVLPLRDETPTAALLLSQRDAGLLALVNITTTPFPLSRLRLSDGVDEAAFDTPTVLEEGECALAFSVQAAAQDSFPICNEAGTRLTLPETFWQRDFTVYLDGQPAATCTGIVCVVTAAADW